MPPRLQLSLRLPDRPARRRWIAAGVIAFLSALVALGAFIASQLNQLDALFYNVFYSMRPVTSQVDGSVVIIGIDERSLAHVEKVYDFGWPWPREYYVPMIRYAERHGAKAVAFDLLFSSKSRTSAEAPDDETFAAGVDAAKIPIVFATIADEKGQPARFAPPVKSPRRFGAANVIDAPPNAGGHSAVLRDYEISKHDMPSLAVKALEAAGLPSRGFGSDRFQLHYYGPHERIIREKNGTKVLPTFRYVGAASVLEAALAEERSEDPSSFGVDPKWFEGKIVLIGSIATALFDAKTTPLSDNFPGVEVHATAIENLIFRQRVREAPEARRLMTLLSACIAAMGAVVFRQVWAKVASLAFAVAALVGVSLLFFLRNDVIFIPPAAPLIAASLAGLAALAWSYLTEDRGRQSMEKALAQYVSPEVAKEIARDPENLGVGAQRRDMTVMFSDIAGFTTMSENMDAEQLTRVLNFYLQELTEPVLGLNGFVDKFIGDAIMSFWNGPLLEQPDHAARACRAALQMVDRERKIQGELRERGSGGEIRTRFGINTGVMAVGNIGSIRKKGYTVIGDSVNLASRLEAANKLYGTQIILTESTLKEAEGKFVVRPLDLLTVSGKTKPMAIYELMAELPADAKVTRLAEQFSRAFEAYKKQDWDTAEALLKEIELYNHDDGPTKTLLERIEHFRHEPPGKNWDGSYKAKSK